MTHQPDTSKRRRLADFGKRSRLTQRALSALMGEISSDGLPDHFSRGALSRAREKIGFDISPSHGPLLRSFPIGNEDVWICDPFAFLEISTRESDSFLDFVEANVSRNENKLSVVLYHDEVVPGNPLAPDLPRRMVVFYYSYREFGFPALTDEVSWITLCVMRTDLIDKLPGRLPQLLKHLLKVFVCGDATKDLRRGVDVVLGGQRSLPKVLTGGIACMVMDEGAFKKSMAVKGAAGTKICALCKNVCQHRSQLAQDPTDTFKPSTELDIRKFEMYTDRELGSIQSRLAKLATGPQTHLDDAMQLTGYLWEPESWLADKTLRAAISLTGCWMWDWMHCFCVAGAIKQMYLRTCSCSFGLNRMQTFGNVQCCLVVLQTWKC